MTATAQENNPDMKGTIAGGILAPTCLIMNVVAISSAELPRAASIPR